jgi:hypothetical protein
MSDGFPSVACADAIPSHGEVVAVVDRSLPSLLVSDRGRKTDEVRTRLIQELRGLWTMTRVGQWIVVPGQDRERSA